MRPLPWLFWRIWLSMMILWDCRKTICFLDLIEGKILTYRALWRRSWVDGRHHWWEACSFSRKSSGNAQEVGVLLALYGWAVNTDRWKHSKCAPRTIQPKGEITARLPIVRLQPFHLYNCLILFILYMFMYIIGPTLQGCVYSRYTVYR